MKAFFLSRLLREKLLLLGLAAIAAAMWLSSLSTRGSAFVREFRATTTELSMQQLVLDNKTRIEAESKAVIAHLDPAKTLNSLRLQTELDAIAHGIGVTNTSADDPHTTQTAQFAVNTIQFTIRNAKYENLIKFYNELSKRAPYIGIEQFSLVANRANPDQVNASFKVSSVEIAR
jgi:hypothetical protein